MVLNNIFIAATFDLFLIRFNYFKIIYSYCLIMISHDQFYSLALFNVFIIVCLYNLSLHTQVTFDVTLEVRSCPSDHSQRSKTFNIYPVGLTEKLTINLELMCECDCEQAVMEVCHQS